ncbi:hypothetical protein PI125_g11731 [Phytophthora idaei]|nr:hypothetical protein PI125_g11731 [Phytophthora idaei]
MTSDRSVFEELDEVSGRQVRVATTKLTPVEGVGSVLLNVRMNDGQTARIRLHQVLYVPKLEMNLLSVYQAVQAGAKFDFHSQSGAVTMSLDFLQVTCHHSNRLYVLHAARSTPEALAVRPDLTLELLHRRFGHANKHSP